MEILSEVAFEVGSDSLAVVQWEGLLVSKPKTQKKT